jgi:hypothetical protein
MTYVVGSQFTHGNNRPAIFNNSPLPDGFGPVHLISGHNLQQVIHSGSFKNNNHPAVFKNSPLPGGFGPVHLISGHYLQQVIHSGSFKNNNRPAIFNNSPLPGGFGPVHLVSGHNLQQVIHPGILMKGLQEFSIGVKYIGGRDVHITKILVECRVFIKAHKHRLVPRQARCDGVAAGLFQRSAGYKQPVDVPQFRLPHGHLCPEFAAMGTVRPIIDHNRRTSMEIAGRANITGPESPKFKVGKTQQPALTIKNRP